MKFILRREIVWNFMNPFADLLSGGDLRSTGKSDLVVKKLRTQTEFNQLFDLLFFEDRIVVMRAADAIEKITKNKAEFLEKHADRLLKICHTAVNKELKWHLALIVPRLKWSHENLVSIWDVLAFWALDKKESRIVRVNSLQGLYELSRQEINLKKELQKILQEVEKEKVPSVIARVKKIKQVFPF